MTLLEQRLPVAYSSPDAAPSDALLNISGKDYIFLFGLFTTSFIAT